MFDVPNHKFLIDVQKDNGNEIMGVVTGLITPCAVCQLGEKGYFHKKDTRKLTELEYITFRLKGLC